MARARARCCWCGGRFVKFEGFYWCETAACRERCAPYVVGVVQTTDGDPDNTKFHYLFVPLPKQVEFEECTARNLLGGGAAGSTKSYICRWRMYRRALKIKDYEGLLIRRTWGELEKHHFRLMEREAKLFKALGIPCEFFFTRREMVFYDTNAIIEGGHMESQDDIDKYLSRERDDISVDEGVTIPPQNLLELSTRARTTKQQVIDDGGARFSVYTNPGGIAAAMLRDFFIEHEPNWEDYSEELKEEYDPADWHYIPGNLEDNPYLPERYQSDLAILQPWRYQQLRYNDWDVLAGTFFDMFTAKTHVADLGDPGCNVEWFVSLDWGYMSPGCVLWWACLPDGIFYIRHEYKFSNATIDYVINQMHEINDKLGIGLSDIRYTVADPALKGANIAAATNKGEMTGESMQETFGNLGWPIILGDNKRILGWTRVREFLKSRGPDPVDPEGKKVLGPSIIVHPVNCKYLIRTLTSAVSAKDNPEDIDTTQDDHALDALRYGAMTRPSPTAVRAKSRPNSFNGTRARMIAFRKRASGTR